MIEIINLHKSFGALQVLKGIDLKMEHGKVLVIIGPSGSGKTTLLRCFNLLEIPDQGSLSLSDITINFTDHKKIPQNSVLALRQKTGMVFQSYNLFPHMTALGNVMEGQVTVLKRSKEEARKRGFSCWLRWVWQIKLITIHISCQVDSSREWPSPGLWQ